MYIQEAKQRCQQSTYILCIAIFYTFSCISESIVLNQKAMLFYKLRDIVYIFFPNNKQNMTKTKKNHEYNMQCSK